MLRFFRDEGIDRITSEDVEKYKTWRSRQKHINRKGKPTDKSLRPATVNRELACLKAMLNYHIKADLMIRNPVSRVKFLNEDNEQMRVLTIEEQNRYLLAASQPLQDIARLMLETGMRPEEVYRIRKENVFIKEGYLFNPYGKTKAAKRKIPLTAASDILARRMDKTKGEYLFPGQGTDSPIVKVNAAHTSAVTRSKVARFRLYDLRHTWATRAAMAGVDLVTLAAMLGHSRIQMVMRYAHPTEEHQFQAMKKMEAFIAASRK